MEIEAKFQVPDDDTLDRLARYGRAGRVYRSDNRGRRLHEDTYLDSPTGLLLRAGYTCRLRRRTAGGTLITVKGLAGAGEVMRREELEVEIDNGVLHPAGWSEGPARELVFAIVGLEGLLPLVALRQERVLRDVSTADGVIAEMSSDRVEVEGGSGGSSGRFLELEIELKGDGAESDLSAVAAALRDSWGLPSERRSKFERALAVVEEQAHRAAAGGQTRGHGGRPGGRGLLTPSELAASTRIAEQNDVYGRRARALVALHEGATQEEAGALAGFSSRRTRYWLAEFRRDRLGIFPVELLEVAVDAEPAAVEEAADEPATAPEEALDEDAAFVMPPLEDPADADLVTEDAAEPDVAPTVTVATITVVEPPPAEVGDGAAERAKATKAATEKKPKAVRPGVRADDTMAEAADKILLFQLRRMIEHEPGTRKGEDIEELHDMRVATRRMRAALRLFEAFLDPEALRPFLKTLRRTGRTLGAVRDLDVFWEKTETLP